MPMPKIDLKTHPPVATLFDTDAANVASELHSSAGNDKINSASQLRRFYDELVGWQERVGTNNDRFNEYVAFIKMLNAKAEYAKGRRPALVNQAFVDWFRSCLAQVNDARSLNHFRLHFEAMLGFLKALRG